MIPLYVDLEQEWRGGQNQALLTLRGLRARGHAAELVAVGECPLARRAQAEGIPVHAVGPRARRFQSALLLRRLLTQRRFDLLHANEPHALTAAWLARAHHRLPLVASRRVAYPLQRNSLALARYRAARRILAISRFVAESVVASGLPTKQVEIVYEGVEVPPLPSVEARRVARRRWGVGGDETLVGCVGYLLPEKGQRFLIRALPAVREHFPNCRLRLAGDGPCRARLGNLVRDLQLESAVHFAGFVEDVAQVAAGLPRPPVVIGHSLGGLVVQKHLETQPAAAGILLASTPPAGGLGPMLHLVRRHPRLWLRAVLTLSPDQAFKKPSLAREAFFSANCPDEIVNACCRQIQEESGLALLGMLAFGLHRPKRVTVPVLVLGAADDAAISPAEVEATAHAYATRAVMVPDMGHHMMLDCGWPAVAGQMLAWLTEQSL